MNTADPGAVLAAALGCSALGWPVVPLDGKAPRVLDWPSLGDDPPSETTIRRWWSEWPTANLGIVGGGSWRLAVLDADSPAEAEAVRVLAADVLAVPEVRTPRGGAHFYFRAPGDVRVLTKAKLGGRALDVRAWGGVVAAPPSVGANGRPYTWADGSTVAPLPAEVPELPAGLLELLNQADALRREGTAGPVRRYPLRPELLAAALEHLRHATRAADGSVRCCCAHPEHDDDRPSAVVYPDGTFRCFSRCGRLWSPAEWTRWPTVRAWAEALVPARTRARASSPVLLRAPRLMVRNVTAGLLAPHPNTTAVRKRGDEWRLFDGCGKPIVTGDLGDLSARILDAGGVAMVRTLWGCIALAEWDSSRWAMGPGQFGYSRARLGALLGYKLGRDRRPDKDARRTVGAAVAALRATRVKFRLSSRSTDTFDGPLVQALGHHSRGWTLAQIHPGAWFQIATNRGCVPWHPAAVRLRDVESLGMYLAAAWEWGDRRRELSGSLEAVAIRLGLWNADRARRDRARYLASWRRWLGEIARLGLARVELTDDNPADPFVLLARPDKAPPRLALPAVVVVGGVARKGGGVLAETAPVTGGNQGPTGEGMGEQRVGSYNAPLPSVPAPVPSGSPAPAPDAASEARRPEAPPSPIGVPSDASASRCVSGDRSPVARGDVAPAHRQSGKQVPMPNGDRSEHDDGAPEHQKEPIGTTRKLTAADRRQARAAAGFAQRVAEVEAKHEAERAAVRADDATFAAEVAAAREALEKMRRGCAA